METLTLTKWYWFWNFAQSLQLVLTNRGSNGNASELSVCTLYGTHLGAEHVGKQELIHLTGRCLLLLKIQNL